MTGDRITSPHWRPRPILRAAVDYWRKIKADFETFDGDRRGIAAALSAASSRVVGALALNPTGDEEWDQDYALIKACATLIAGEVERADRPAEPVSPIAPTPPAPRRMTIVDALAVMAIDSARCLNHNAVKDLIREAEQVVGDHVRRFRAGRENPQPPAHGR